MQLRQAAVGDKRAKYRAIINSILLRLKKRIEEYKMEQAKEQQKQNIRAIGDVLSRYLGKREIKSFTKDVMRVQQGMTAKQRIKYDFNDQNTSVDLGELLSDAVMIEPYFETKYELMNRLLDDHNTNKRN